jgi:hypothetical protein
MTPAGVYLCLGVRAAKRFRLRCLQSSWLVRQSDFVMVGVAA